MPIKRAELDTTEKFATSVSVYAGMFGDMRQQKDALEGVQNARIGFEARLKRIDAAMSKFLKETIDLTLWGVRMRGCIKKFHTLDKNLAFIEKPQYDWDEVTESLAFLFAVIQGAEETLYLNGIDMNEGHEDDEAG